MGAATGIMSVADEARSHISREEKQRHFDAGLYRDVFECFARLDIPSWNYQLEIHAVQRFNTASRLAASHA
jgi:hypothetical protein